MSEITNLQPTPITLNVSSTPTEEVNTKKRKNMTDINEMLENISQNVKQAKLFENDIALRIKQKNDLAKKIEIEQKKLEQNIHDNYALVNHLKNLDKPLKLKQEFILKIEEMRKEFYSKMENQNVASCDHCGHKDGKQRLAAFHIILLIFFLYIVMQRRECYRYFVAKTQKGRRRI